MTQRPGRRLGAWCAGLLLAGVSPVVGRRVADTDGITPVPRFLAFLPWLLAPAGLALLCALFALRQRPPDPRGGPDAVRAHLNGAPAVTAP